MKRIFLSLPLFVPFTTSAQNLVVDPSFEAHTACPDWASQIDRTSHWSAPNKATTDYYHTCSPAFASHVPYNMAGKQWPHSGKAYAGIVTRANDIAYSELVQGKLTGPLIMGAYYKVSYYVSLAGISKYMDEDLGAFFATDELHSAHCAAPVPEHAHVVHGMHVPECKDVDSWQLVTGIYQALGGESVIVIGNVSGSRSKAKKNKMVHPQVKDAMSYYYIDDVSVVRAQHQHDTAFDRNEVRSTAELSIGPALTVASCNAIFEEGTSGLRELEAINELAQQDTGAVPALAMVEYLANFVIENPAVYLEIGVRHPQVNNAEAALMLTRARAVAIVGLLADMGVSPERMTIVGHGTEPSADVHATRATPENDGVIEMRITELDEAPRPAIRYVQAAGRY